MAWELYRRSEVGHLFPGLRVVCHLLCPMDLPFEEDAGAGDGSSSETLASTVLVVDDEEVVRDVFSRLLSREPDLIVATVESGETALNLLRNRRFDLLITDK